MTRQDIAGLYISYNGMLDPLGQSQVIPYLRELSRQGVRFTLLSFERALMTKPEVAAEATALHQSLTTDDIDWHWLPYHRRPSLPATSYDVWAGTRYASGLMRDTQFDFVHARSHVAAAIALRLKRHFGVKMVFDLRGLLADEYVDAGHWRKNSLAYRVTKTSERRFFKAADGIVTLTERIWPIIEQWEGLRGRNVVHEVVPCCADLDRFQFSAVERARHRRELKLEDRFVVVYCGSIDGWYLTEEMADCFLALRRRKPEAHLLWLTPARHDRIRSLMQERGLGNGDYTIVSAAPQEVPAYLSASDIGLAFIKNCFSKLASSPTKYAEYLACGLPLIINAGIGDSDALIRQEGAGILVENPCDTEYAKAAAMLESIVKDAGRNRKRSREIAEKLFDVRRVGAPRYARLYQRVLGNQEI